MQKFKSLMYEITSGKSLVVVVEAFTIADAEKMLSEKFPTHSIAEINLLTGTSHDQDW